MARRSLAWAFAVAVGVVYLAPVVMVGYGAFRSDAPGQPGVWTLQGLRTVWSDPLTWPTVRSSILLAIGAGGGATVLAAVLAWVVTRTTAALRRMVTPLMAVVLAVPGLFFALSWSLLGMPHSGLVNRVLAGVGLPDDTVHVTGAAGSVFVVGLKLTSLCYLMLLGPFLGMDRRLEEAARVAGARPVRMFLTVVVPVLAPAVLGVFVVAFAVGLTAFDIPVIVGVPGGFRVLSTQIYAYVRDSTPPQYAAGSTLAVLLVVVVIALVCLKWRLLDRRQFTTLTGKAARPEPWPIGRWTWACNALIAGYAVLAVVLPTVQLVVGSLQPVFGIGTRYTWDNYRALLADPFVGEAIRNTLLLGVGGGLVAMGLALTIGLTARGGTTALRRSLELPTWLPWAARGIVLGLGLVWAFLTVPALHPLFATVWIVLIGLVVAVTPLAGRTIEPALAQIGVELAESARVAGAGPVRANLGIVARLAVPSFLAGWLICAVEAAGNLEVPILLSAPSNETLAVSVYQLYVNGDTAQAAALFCLYLALAAVFALAAAGGWVLARRLRVTPEGLPWPQ